MHQDLEAYLRASGWTSDRSRRMVDGLRVLQGIAKSGVKPITYTQFAERIQPGLAAIATSTVLEDIGQFCNAAGWPNVTCLVISAETGECSSGFSKVSSEDPESVRDRAWLTYAAYKDGPLVDDADG